MYQLVITNRGNYTITSKLTPILVELIHVLKTIKNERYP